MIDIIISGERGEGTLKSLCDIVKTLEKDFDTYKIFVLDDERTLYSTSALDNYYVIDELNEKTYQEAIKANEKIILILSSVLNVNILKKEKVNSKAKIYFVYKTIKH